MRAGALGLLVWMTLLCGTAFSGPLETGAVDGFLATRRILGSVAFEQNSAMLDDKGRETLDSLVSALKEIHESAQLIRIEGFAVTGEKDGDVLSLAMARAHSVENYLREHYDLAVSYYLTGFGPGKSQLKIVNPSSRADVAVYDNLWSLGAAPGQKIVLNLRP